MINYISTRGDTSRLSFSDALLKGIASDGGLFVPERIPKLTLSTLDSLLSKSYQERAFALLELFETDVDSKTLKRTIHQAYAKNFDHIKFAPTVHLKNNQYLIELWHGPTAAFKDFALQLKPLLFSEAVQKDNQKRTVKGEQSRKYLILVATSGDTGKAALEGYKNKEGISIVVFYPLGSVSKLQELSMITQDGRNVQVIGMEGDFDDTQRCVKETFNDRDFNNYLWDKYQVVLSSANSINWGRLFPQIVYHISGYVNLIETGVIKPGDEIDIAIPTGNCGNIMAAFYAKRMGLPVRRLICASNENNVLTEVLRTGIYDVSNRKLTKTPSPSMDILIASNFERLLYEITQSPKKIVSWMRDLKERQKFSVDEQTKKVFKKLFYADWVTNEDCLKTIKRNFEETGYLMDPHTAVAKAVVDRYIQDSSTSGESFRPPPRSLDRYTGSVPIIICSTAHWAKFGKDVYNALIGNKREIRGIKGISDEFAVLSKIVAMVPKSRIPQCIAKLKTKTVKHTASCEANKESVQQELMRYLKRSA